MADSNLTMIIKARDEASKTLKGISKDAKALGDALGGLGNIALAGLTLPIVGLGAAMTKLAMDATESENLYEVSMKNMAQAGREWSEQMKKSLGLNAVEVRRNLGVWQNFLTSMDLSERAAFDMGKSLTALSHDMASFFNQSQGEMFLKLQSGISGEIEPLRRLGIVVNETAVKTWALNNGLAKQGQELSEGQKVLARYALIMEQTGNAQGDLARTIDSPANQLRIMKEQVKDLATSMGTQLLPSFVAVLQVARNSLTSFQAFSVTNPEMIKMGLAAAAVTAALGPLLVGLSMLINTLGTLARAVLAVRVALAGMALAALPAAAALAPVAVAVIGLGAAAVATKSIWDNHLQGMKTSTIDNTTVIRSHLDATRQEVFKLQDQMSKFPDLTHWGPGGPGSSQKGPKFVDPKHTPQSQRPAWELEMKMRETNSELDKQNDLLNFIKSQWNEVGSTVAKAGKDTSDSARNMLASTSQIVDALVRMDPAAIAAAAGVNNLKIAISGVQAAIARNNDAMHSAQNFLSGLQSKSSDLSEALSKAKSRLEDLANVRLPGMNAMDDKAFQIEQQIKRLKLAQMGGDVSGFQVSPMWANFVGSLPTSIEELEKMLEVMRLQKSLSYDDMLRQIQQAARGIPKEMSFADALKAIAGTKGEISGLEGELSGIQGAIRGVQNSLAEMSEANYQLNKQLAVYQEQLQGAEGKQQAVNDVLKEAYNWLVEQRPELIKYGGEWLTQVNLVDEQTRRLVIATREMVKDETAGAIGMINSALLAYQTFRAQMTFGGQNTATPNFGSPSAGGSVLPPPSAPQLGSGTPATQIINVNVSGSVVTEKEIAEIVRQQLIKTGKRNVNIFGSLQ